MSEPVTIEVTIAAPVEVVWESLRDPAAIRRWHGWHAESLDEEITIIYATDASEPEPHVLQLGSGDRFVLTAVDGGTRVTLTRAPIGANPEWDAWYEDINEGWTTFLQQLRFAMEHHPGQDRHTLFLDVTAADQPDPTALLTGADAPERGEQWYRSEHQLGVVLDSLGPGLIAAGVKPAHGEVPGGAMAVVSAFGVDTVTWTAARESWIAWWRSHYPTASDPT